MIAKLKKNIAAVVNVGRVKTNEKFIAVNLASLRLCGK